MKNLQELYQALTVENLLATSGIDYEIIEHGSDKKEVVFSEDGNEFFRWHFFGTKEKAVYDCYLNMVYQCLVHKFPSNFQLKGK